jgi:ATP-binding cassette subfamily B protein
LGFGAQSLWDWSNKSERAIQQAFATALVGRTSLVIAHRLSTVQTADQILVLQNGRIVEQGRHEELVRAGNLYAKLYLKQFKEPSKGDEDSRWLLATASAASGRMQFFA